MYPATHTPIRSHAKDMPTRLQATPKVMPERTAFPALQFRTADLGAAAVSAVAGWAFDVTAEPLAVTALGFFDAGATGLKASHEVGLWGPDGCLLARVVVPAGTQAPLDRTRSFRSIPIERVWLPAGRGYTIAATFGIEDDDAALRWNRFDSIPGLRYVGNRVAAQSDLTHPTESFYHQGAIGPMLFVEAAAPAPGGSALNPLLWEAVNLLTMGSLVAALRK